MRVKLQITVNTKLNTSDGVLVRKVGPCDSMGLKWPKQIWKKKKKAEPKYFGEKKIEISFITQISLCLCSRDRKKIKPV